MRITNTRMRHVLFAGLAVSLGACSTAGHWRSEPVRVESAYGDAVQQMLSAQSIQPVGPVGEYAPDGINGERAAIVYKNYRGHASRPKDVQRPINFNIISGGRR